jgi:lysophospholipase L1-like esterase
MMSTIVICHGNSLTNGYGAGEGQNYPTQLGALLGAGFAVGGRGVNGVGTWYLSAEAPTIIDPQYDPVNFTNNIVIVWEITNDLATGTSGAEAVSRIWDYCAARRAVGWKVMTMTVLPRYDTDIAAQRTIANTLLRNNWASNCDGLIDIGDNATLQTIIAGQGNDGVHLSAEGYGIVAQAAKGAILTLINAGTPVVNSLVIRGRKAVLASGVQQASTFFPYEFPQTF